MTEEQKTTLFDSLIQFVVRASAENAKPEELQLLPTIVGSLLSTIPWEH